MATLHPIAYLKNPFDSKFAIPRQSNVVDSLTSLIVFEPEYRNPDAVRGIEEFDYLWLIWQFSENISSEWHPTVRPPRLGGNTRMGVFATRSSFRPNFLALSSVRLLRVEIDDTQGPLLYVAGADIMNGTPIFDIKPYLPYTDAHPSAASGFAPSAPVHTLQIDCPDRFLQLLSVEFRQPLLDALALDPRPAFHHDPSRIYGFNFAGLTIQFTVDCNHVLHVVNIF